MLRIIIGTTVPETFSTILRLQPRFLAKWFDVELVSSRGENNITTMLSQREGLKYHNVEMYRGISPLKDLISIFRMIFLFLRRRPVIVHSYTPKAGLVMMVAAFICRVPIRVHTFTGLLFPTASGLRKKLLMLVDRLICMCATSVVPEGAGVARDLISAGITKKTLRMIGNGNIAGIDTDYVTLKDAVVVSSANALRQHLGFDDGDFVFSYIGRLNKDKGLFELVSAFSALPINAHLLVVGALDHTAPIDHEIQTVISEHPRIHMVGFMEDVRIALALSTVFVLPSYREGFPNVILEAAAMELPTIATDINGCNEFIEPNENGWLVKPRNVGDLAQTMMHAMELGRDELKFMGRRAREKVKLDFERSDHWERMRQFYEQQVDLTDYSRRKI